MKNYRSPVLNITFLILGAIIGFVLAWNDLGSWFIRWQRMPQLPAKASEIVSFDGNVFIKTKDGAIYSKDVNGGSGQGEWARLESPVVPQEDASYPPRITRPCDFSAKEFNFLTGAPKEITDCAQVRIQYPEASRYMAYIIDQSGDVWEWRKSSDLWAGFFGLCFFPILGGIAGLLLAAVLPASMRLLKRQPTVSIPQDYSVLRWSARVFSIISILLGFIFFIIVRDFTGDYGDRLFFLFVCAGLILSWFREGPGALITLGSLLVRFITIINWGIFWWYFGAMLVFTAPGFLFLAYWLLSRRTHKKI